MTTRTSCPECDRNFDERRDNCPECGWKMEYRDTKLLAKAREHPIVATVLFLFVVGALASIGDGESADSTQPSPDQQRALELISHDMATGEYGGYVIEGRIRNTSGRALSYVEVEIQLVDGAGNAVGSTLDNITDLAAGQTWRFSAPMTEDEAMDYRITGVEYRE